MMFLTDCEFLCAAPHRHLPLPLNLDASQNILVHAHTREKRYLKNVVLCTPVTIVLRLGQTIPDGAISSPSTRREAPGACHGHADGIYSFLLRCLGGAVRPATIIVQDVVGAEYVGEHI